MREYPIVHQAQRKALLIFADTWSGSLCVRNKRKIMIPCYYPMREYNQNIRVNYILGYFEKG